ncbi:DnaJ-domain-containing protein [Trametopsis cervina]|nr:DnaJ-domain-containing protein [Trametopsis cervina]
MASNLYEVLGLDRTATAEDVRKAYRKRALKTHPDRLPQGVSEAQKQEANEQFRIVNHAYEVLVDESKRKLYDQHGIWPPPTAVPQPQAGPSSTSPPNYQSQNRTFSAFGNTNPFESDPFFTGRPYGPSPTFTFTDPFELFNSLFGDVHNIHDDFNDPFFGNNPFMTSPFGTSRGSRGPFGSSLTSQMGQSLFSNMLRGMGGANVRSYSSTTQSIGSGGQWVSQSTVTRSINGRTETITKRRDAQGNEHVTLSSPEGERYTINGVDQPTNRPLPSSQPPAQLDFSPYQQHTQEPAAPHARKPSVSVHRSQPGIAVAEPDYYRGGSSSTSRLSQPNRQIYDDGHRYSRDQSSHYSASHPYHADPTSSSGQGHHSRSRNKIYAASSRDHSHHVGDRDPSYGGNPGW